MIPEWAIKHKIKGTIIRKRNNESYYLYKVHSERQKGKKYPVLIQDEILGIIFEHGIEYCQKKVVDPHNLIIKKIDSTQLYETLNSEDKKNLKNLYLIKINDTWYFSKTTNKEKIILKNNNINWENGVKET